jgi:hypothetical protein
MNVSAKREYAADADTQFYTCHAIKAGNIGDECNGNAHQGFELPDGTFLGPECEHFSAALDNQLADWQHPSTGYEMCHGV